MCTHENGQITSMLGIPVSPCVYDEIERYENVTVIISKCKKCGEIDIAWKKQENTKKVSVDLE